MECPAARDFDDTSTKDYWEKLIFFYCEGKA